MRIIHVGDERWQLGHPELGLELELVYTLGRTWAFWWHDGRLVGEATVGDA